MRRRADMNIFTKVSGLAQQTRYVWERRAPTEGGGEVSRVRTPPCPTPTPSILGRGGSTCHLLLVLMLSVNTSVPKITWGVIGRTRYWMFQVLIGKTEAWRHFEIRNNPSQTNVHVHTPSFASKVSLWLLYRLFEVEFIKNASISTASWGLCSNVPSTGPLGGWVQ